VIGNFKRNSGAEIDLPHHSEFVSSWRVKLWLQLLVTAQNITIYQAHKPNQVTRIHWPHTMKWVATVHGPSLGKTQDKPYNYNKRPLQGCRGRPATLRATAKEISKSVTCTNISHWYIQICVVERRGYVLRNASLGDFVVVRNS